jgi:hypothetical protein
MTWNLRLVDRAEGGEEPYIEICEVYYDTLGKPIGYCQATMGGEDKEEIKTYLEWALEALNRPVIYFGEIIGEE